MEAKKWITVACLLAGACGGHAIKEPPEDEVGGARGYGGSTSYVPSQGGPMPGSGASSFAGTVGMAGPAPGAGALPSGGMASIPEPPSVLGHCDAMPPEPLPLIVTNSYAASGFYETSHLELTETPCQDRLEGAVGHCLGFSWAPASLTWVGLLFQYPANNWDGPGLCIEEGANQVSFLARGEVGGEVVEFSAVDAVLSTVLSTSWTRYTIDLGGIDYNDHFFQAGGVRGAFSIVLTRSENDLEPKRVYVDDLQWQNAETEAGGERGAGGAGGAGGADNPGEERAGAGGFGGLP